MFKRSQFETPECFVGRRRTKLPHQLFFGGGEKGESKTGKKKSFTLASSPSSSFFFTRSFRCLAQMEGQEVVKGSNQPNSLSNSQKIWENLFWPTLGFFLNPSTLHSMFLLAVTLRCPVSK